MSQIFTPQPSSRPTRTAPKSPTPRQVASVSFWQLWRPRLIKGIRWVRASLRTLARLVGRYIRGLSRTQRYQHAAIILGTIALIVLFNLIFSRDTTAPTQNSKVTSGAQLPKESPTFSAILPKGTSASDFGGWTRVSPSDRNPSYVYADTLEGVTIRVNEQPIPDTFRSDLSGSVETLADDFGATHTLDAGGTKVYIGTNAKGPQSLIFIKHDLLISITSNAAVPDDQWIAYIKSLQ